MKQRGVLVISSLLSMLVVVFSCEAPSQQGNEEIPLTNTVWKLRYVKALDGSVLFTPDLKWGYWVRFFEPDSLEGQWACNSCGGEYQLHSGDSISISFGCTKVNCDTSWYSGYFDAVNAVWKYKLEDDWLDLYTIDRDQNIRVLSHRAEEE